jgi:hypothetical protein
MEDGWETTFPTRRSWSSYRLLCHSEPLLVSAISQSSNQIRHSDESLIHKEERSGSSSSSGSSGQASTQPSSYTYASTTGRADSGSGHTHVQVSDPGHGPNPVNPSREPAAKKKTLWGKTKSFFGGLFGKKRKGSGPNWRWMRPVFCPTFVTTSELLPGHVFGITWTFSCWGILESWSFCQHIDVVLANGPSKVSGIVIVARNIGISRTTFSLSILCNYHLNLRTGGFFPSSHCYRDQSLINITSSSILKDKRLQEHLQYGARSFEV